MDDDRKSTRSLPLQALSKAGHVIGEYRGPVALVVVFLLGVLFGGQNAQGQRIFLTTRTHTDILFEYAEYGILAAGMTLVILTAGIDLSVGSVLGLSSVVFSLLVLGYGMPPLLACLVAACVGALCGAVNGLLISRARFQPFVATLAMMVVARGLAKQVAGHQKIQPGLEAWYRVQSMRDMPSFYTWMTSKLAGTGPPPALWAVPVVVVVAALLLMYTARGRRVAEALGAPRTLLYVVGTLLGVGTLGWLLSPHLQPASYLFLISTALMALIVKYTRFGRHLYAIGGNEEAARLSGVPVGLSKVFAYVICGMLSGLAGVSSACRLQLGNPEAGATYELDAIASVVIGGTSLMGGRGGVILTLIGALIMGCANKILSNIQINGEYLQDGAKLLAKGFIIVLAVIVQESRRKRA